MRVKTKDAAERLGIPEQTLRLWLQKGAPFGEVVIERKAKGGRRTYYINADRLENYLKGGANDRNMESGVVGGNCNS